MKQIILTGILLGLLSQVILPARIPPEPQISREWVLPITSTALVKEEIPVDTVGFLLFEWLGFATPDGQLLQAERRAPYMVVSNNSSVRFDPHAEAIVVLGVDGRPRFRVEEEGHPFFINDRLHILTENRLSLIWFEDDFPQLLKANTPLYLFAGGKTFSVAATLLGNIYPLSSSPPLLSEPPLLSLAVSPGGQSIFTLNGDELHHARIFSLEKGNWKEKTVIPVKATTQNTLPAVFLSEKEVLFATPNEIRYLDTRNKHQQRQTAITIESLYSIERKGISIGKTGTQWYLTLWRIPLQRIFHEVLPGRPSFFQVEGEFCYLGFDSTLLKFRIFNE